MPAVMYSAKTVASLDGKAIRLGGYPVPLENDAKGRVTGILPGALSGRLHPRAAAAAEPDRPGALSTGLKLTDIYTPLWVSGTLKIEQVSNDPADAAYAIDKARVKVVEEADL